MIFNRGSAVRALMLTAAMIPLAACSTRGGVPKVGELSPTRSASMEQAVGNEFDISRPAIRRVRLSGDFFALKPLGKEIPADIAQAKVRLDFSGQQPTFDDLTLLLEEQGLSVILGWDDGSYGSNASVAPQQTPAAAPSVESDSGWDGGSQRQGNTPLQASQPQQAVQAPVQSANLAGARTVSDLRRRPLPFRRYEGTLGGLFKQLQRSMGVTMWWNDGIYVSPVGRYSVMLPQNKDLMAQVVTELQAKGASNVVASLQAGTVSFVAPGALADEVIRPYLIRLGRNASEVTMQVALVSVVMNEDTAKGFDWSKFNLSFGDSTNNGLSDTETDTGTGTDTGVGTGLGTGSANSLPKSGLFTFGQEATRFFAPSVNILGSRRPLDINGAIKFLSTYGSTAVDQNVELRTLAGTAVNWRSGETIPYVSGVSAMSSGLGGFGSTGGLNSGLGGALGSAQTEKLETGLTLNLAPTYESNGGLVTVSFKLELTELIEMVELSAGNQLGSFTQPRTREQKLDDIVRIPVGETVVLGGLRRQLASVNRNGPFSAYSIGSKAKKSEVQTVFIILRPSVTTYEVAGLDQPLPAKLNSIQIGADGRPWTAPANDYRGTTMFGESVNGSGPERRKAMAQPVKGN